MWVSTRRKELADNLVGRCQDLLKRRRDIEHDLGRALWEFKSSGYHTLYGYSSFDAWLGSGVLDIPVAEARRIIAFVEKVKGAGIPLAEVEQLPKTSRDAIVALPSNTPLADVRELIQRASKEPAYRIKQSVAQARGATPCEVFGPIRVFDASAQRTIRQALRRVAGEKGVSTEVEKWTRICSVYLDTTRGA